MRHEYKGYCIEEHSWDAFLGDRFLGHTVVYFVTKGKDGNGMPVLVRFLKKNGQEAKISSLKTAKRYISIFERRKK